MLTGKRKGILLGESHVVENYALVVYACWGNSINGEMYLVACWTGMTTSDLWSDQLGLQSFFFFSLSLYAMVN